MQQPSEVGPVEAAAILAAMLGVRVEAEWLRDDEVNYCRNALAALLSTNIDELVRDRLAAGR